MIAFGLNKADMEYAMPGTYGRGLMQKDLEDDDKLARTYISKVERASGNPTLLRSSAWQNVHG